MDPKYQKKVVRKPDPLAGYSRTDRLRIGAGLTPDAERKKATRPTLYMDPYNPWPKRIALTSVAAAGILLAAWVHKDTIKGWLPKSQTSSSLAPSPGP